MCVCESAREGLKFFSNFGDSVNVVSLAVQHSSILGLNSFRPFGRDHFASAAGLAELRWDSQLLGIVVCEKMRVRIRQTRKMSKPFAAPSS